MLRLCFLWCCLFVAENLVGQQTYPFHNRDLPVEKRIDNILSLLTIDEKIACLGTNPTVQRLGIVGTGHSEGLHGLAVGVPGGWGHKVPIATTTFPQSIGMAETWDTALISRAAAIEGFEARYLVQSKKYKRAGLVIRAPNADLGRDPRWGRTEECYGEDAFFTGTMVVAFIRGLQGEDPRYWQAASLMKHFLANSNENGRDSSSSDFDERLLREYYSVPFRMGIVQGGSRAFMASYNKVNGIPQTVNPMLENMAVNEWGQNGIICTDGGAYRLLISAHHYYRTPEEAATACIKAGINQFLDRHTAGVKAALDKKMLTEADIDHVLRGVFRVMIKLGQLDDPSLVPYSNIGKGSEPWLSAENRSFARLITGKSIVLLKNDHRFLPLNKASVKSIAILGSRSDQVFQDWYSGSSAYSVSPLEGIITKLGPGVVVNHTTDENLAINIAATSEVAIVCVGNNPTGNAGWKNVSVSSEGKEAVDRAEINLDSAQEKLIERVYSVNPRTVVVLISSFPYAINWANATVPAIVHMTHNSQELGNALADVLFGDVNPGGHLVQTWPSSLSQLPPMMDYNLRHGRTYMYFKGVPLYPFGYGLSYTSFAFSPLKLSLPSLKKNGEIVLSIDITNTGTREGDEVVQLYVRHLGSKVDRPHKELKGFSRVSMKPQETKTVNMILKGADLAYWDIKTHRFVVEKDKIELQVGASSADIRERQTVSIR